MKISARKLVIVATIAGTFALGMGAPAFAKSGHSYIHTAHYLKHHPALAAARAQIRQKVEQQIIKVLSLIHSTHS
jgi:hypothetical protein